MLNNELKVIDSNTIFGFWPKRKVDISIEHLSKIINKHKVWKALSFSARGIFIDYIRGNKETLSAREKHPWLVPVGTIDPREGLNVMDEVDNLYAQRVRFIRFFPELQVWSYNQSVFRSVIKKISKHPGIVIFIPLSFGISNILKLSEDIHNKIIISDFGYGNLAEILFEAPKISDRIYFGTEILNSIDAFEIFCANIGADRLIFGSRAPLSYFSSSFEMVINALIPEEDKRAILSENMLKLISGGK